MSRTLLLMRHATPMLASGLADHERPLNPQGEATAPRMGRWLVAQREQPDAIIASTATRARRTAELVSAELNHAPAVRTVDSLYLPYVEETIEVVACQGGAAGRLLVVCHNPGISEAVHALAGMDEYMSTATVAVLDFEIDVWSDLLVSPRGLLRHVWRAGELPAE